MVQRSRGTCSRTKYQDRTARPGICHISVTKGRDMVAAQMLKLLAHIGTRISSVRPLSGRETFAGEILESVICTVAEYCFIDVQ